MKSNTTSEIRHPHNAKEGEELFLFRHNGGRSYYCSGPGDYMLRRGIDLCFDISQGDYREDFRREAPEFGGTLAALATFVLADWSEHPGNDLRGSAAATIIFPNASPNLT